MKKSERAVSVDLSEHKVLITHSNRAILLVLRNALMDFGAKRPAIACDGRDGIDAMCAEGYDLVFTGWRMPGVDGRELVQWVRQSPQSRNIQLPIIAVVDAGERAAMKAARDAGVHECLSPPLSHLSIQRAVDRALNHKRDFIQAAGYVGPCRRSRAQEGAATPGRRADDPVSNRPSPQHVEERRQAVKRAANDVADDIRDRAKQDTPNAATTCQALETLARYARDHGDAAMYRLGRMLAGYLRELPQLDPSDLQTTAAYLHDLGRLGTNPANGEHERCTAVHTMGERLSAQLGTRRSSSRV